jgi:hypothetical protein
LPTEIIQYGDYTPLTFKNESFEYKWYDLTPEDIEKNKKEAQECLEKKSLICANSVFRRGGKGSSECNNLSDDNFLNLYGNECKSITDIPDIKNVVDLSMAPIPM